jgi:hypothetical protein
LERLRRFVGSLEAERLGSVPHCVAEYYDKMSSYHIRRPGEVIELGERRLNK